MRRSTTKRVASVLLTGGLTVAACAEPPADGAGSTATGLSAGDDTGAPMAESSDGSASPSSSGVGDEGGEQTGGSTGEGLDEGSTGGDSGTVPPAVGDHSYFEWLMERPDVLAGYSLRDPSQLVDSAFTYEPDTDAYHSAQDAAKGVVPAGDGMSDANVGGHGSGGQLRLPVDVSEGRLIYTWDVWWGAEFEAAPQEIGGEDGLRTHKAFQIASNVRQPDESSIWFEVRSHYGQAPGTIGSTDARAYGTGLDNPILGPGTTGEGGGQIGPLLANFTLQTQTWTRYWVEIEVDTPSTDDFAEISMWAADETTEPTLLLDKVLLHSGGTMTEFWLEFNSSQKRGVGSEPLTLYVRNLVMLHDPADPASALLQAPVPAD
ncbi:MAG: hypothetical protein AAF721_33340 [Myxococcota bacterium]